MVVCFEVNKQEKSTLALSVGTHSVRCDVKCVKPLKIFKGISTCYLFPKFKVVISPTNCHGVVWTYTVKSYLSNVLDFYISLFLEMSGKLYSVRLKM